jgi:Fe2+ transport system protein FeoA
MSKQVKRKTLLDIPKGGRCKVARINRDALASKRLVEMGISKGTVIEVERVAPLGDPVEVLVKGYHLSVRKSEAAAIEVD